MAAEAILGNVVTEILKKCCSLIAQEIRLARKVKEDLKKLETTVKMIQAVLADAERKQVKEEAVRLWLKSLQDLAYEADDILDDFLYELMRRDQENRKRDKVLNFFSSSSPIVFRSKMARELKDINLKFDEIAKQKNNFNLQSSSTPVMIVDDERRENRKTFSFVEESTIIGRENDKKKILEMLMNTDGSNTDRISVIPIVGMGGLGKTSLAKLIYNAESVKEQYKPRIWVCVSDYFDLTRILRDLLESITDGKCDDVSSKEVLVRRLHEQLSGKKYFLVLDDMWNENPREWMELENLLGVGDKTSKIIVTTRKNKVALIVKRNLPSFELSKLKDDECWSVFERSAFDTDEVVNPNLLAMGREMVTKCKGLPLAAMVLGGVMRSKKEHEWQSIRNNEIWDTLDHQNTISPVLKLSYDYLPSELKQCFSYCAIFPKDFKFKRQSLIQLWSAEGFLDDQKNNKEREDVGNEYFHSLLRNSLFQDVEEDKFGNIEWCKMHDLLHDLAQTISGNNVRANTKTSVIKTGQGESFRLWLNIHDDNSVVQEALNSKHKLRTCFARGAHKSIVDSVIGAQRLRVLDLAWIGVEELPPSIGKLKHLRYLDLSGNDGLRKLPGSIIKLYNLETLILYGCNLEVLPDDIGSLKNLRYLDLSHNFHIKVLPESFTGLTNLGTLILKSCDKLLVLNSGIGSLKKLRNLDVSEISMDVLPEYITALTDLQTLLCYDTWPNELKMPRGLGRLSNLQTLQRFHVGKEDTEAGIGELEHLNLLRGKLEINNLEYVKDGIEAQRANLKWKSNIDVLELSWGYRSVGFDMDEVVLEGLQPHSNLKRLKISYFMGVKLPTWLNPCILRSFLNLVEIGLFSCDRCEQLSGLGQLPSLKKLNLWKMSNLKEWENEEEEEASPTTNKQSLQFPCLEFLSILFCPSLIITPTLFPSLKQLDVSDISVMAVRSLVTRRSNHLKSLTSLSIEDIPELNFLPRDLLQPNLQSLEIFCCGKFKGFVQNEENEEEMCSFFDASYLRDRLTSLTKLRIDYGEHSKGFPVALGCLTSLEELKIRCLYAPSSEEGEEGNIIQQQEQNWFRSLRSLVVDGCSLPQQIQHLIKLQELEIYNLGDMVALPEWVGNLSSLRKLEINHCLQLTHLQSEQVMRRLTSLKELNIRGISETSNCFPVEGIQHLTALQFLSLSGFNGLLELPEWLGNLSSLECLTIIGCENLEYLPSLEAMKRLTALSYLFIMKCPLLTKRCTKETGEEWHKISHIKCVDLN